MRKLFGLLFVLALVLSFSLVATTPVMAQPTYYVATTGNDGNTGAAGDPWRTIQHAVDTVPAGSTILVSAGTYNEAVQISTDDLHIRGLTGAVVDGTGLGPVDGFYLVSSRVRIEGFIIQYFRFGIRMNSGDGHTIEGNQVAYSGFDGIFAQTGDDHIISRNDVRHNVRRGISVRGDGSTVSENSAMYNAEGIRITNATMIDVEGNVVTDNDDGIVVFTANHNTIRGNFVSGNDGCGIRIDGEHNAVTGNTITGNERGVFFEWFDNTNTVNFNSIFGNVSMGLQSDADEVAVDARWNWWGHASGPGGVGPGTGDAVSANVDFTPWYFLEDLRIPVTSYDDIDDTATGTGPARFGASEGAIENLRTVEEADLPEEGKPELEFPHGFFALDIVGVTVGGEVTVSIMLPEPAHPDTEYWKHYGDAWHQIPMTIDPIDPRIIHITLVDGGLGDADGLANGAIIDQGGPGNPLPPPPPRVAVGWEGSPVNKLMVMAPWIALFAAMIAGASLLVVRRRRAQT